MSIRGIVLEYIQSYLIEDSIYVHFNNEESSRLSIICGIPQG